MHKRSELRKKLSVVLMTIAMIVMMAVPAFAAEDDASAITSLSFTKTFSANGGLLPDASFGFSMTPVSGATGKTTDGLNIYPGPTLGSKASVDLTFNGKTQATQTGSFDLSGLSFDKPGAYRYTVQEVIPQTKASYITYDEKVYVVELLVDNTGKIQVARTVSVNGEAVENSKKTIEFTNTCSVDSLTVTKTVSGAMADKSKAFTFYLDIPATGDNLNLTSGSEIKGKIESTSGQKTDVTFTVGGENAFSLKHGEKLTIDNLPEGMIYKVTEADYSEDGYKTTVAGPQDTAAAESRSYDASAAGKNTPIADGGNTVAFTNALEYTTPTGVALNVAPFILILAVALFAAVLFIRKGRKAVR